MSAVTRAPHGGHDQRPAPTRAQQKGRALGLTSATGLVVGSIVGTGVFAMPAVLAGAGTSSLLVLAVIALGAILLAMLFGQLTRRIPNSDGGLYAYADFARYYGDDDANHQPATVEGGDVHVLGHGAVMIGMGERSTPMAVELLAGALFRAGQASRVIAVELPASRAMMHLDTVLTMLDRDTFVQYPYLERQPRSWTLTPNGDDLSPRGVWGGRPPRQAPCL
jgi:Arginine deiminase/Amino acid permease